jgi:hypothetical protein
LDLAIRKYFGNTPTIIGLGHETMGQACTVREVSHLINNSALLIHNTDTYFECDFSFLSQSGIHGAIPYFHSSDIQMSFIALDTMGWVTNVAEKKPISKNATVGAYYFAHGHDFLVALDQALDNDQSVLGEYYISPLYNTLIEKKKKIIGVPSSNVCDLGTPEKLENNKHLLQVTGTG